MVAVCQISLGTHRSRLDTLQERAFGAPFLFRIGRFLGGLSLHGLVGGLRACAGLGESCVVLSYRIGRIELFREVKNPILV